MTPKQKALKKKQKAIKYFYKEGVKNVGEEKTKHAMRTAFRIKPGTEHTVDRRIKDPNDIRHLVKAERNHRRRFSKDGLLHD